MKYIRLIFATVLFLICASTFVGAEELTTTIQESTVAETTTQKNINKPAKKKVKKKAKKIPKKAAKFISKKIKISKVTILTKQSINLKWKKIKGADAYQIFMKNNKGKFKKIKTLKKKNELTVKKLKYGNDYYFTIRAVKKIKGKKYFTKPYKKGKHKKLKVKGKYKGSYKYFYDMDGKKIKNVMPFLNGKQSYCLKVNIVSSVMTIYAKDGSRGYTIPVKAYLCSGNTWDRTGTFSLGVKYRFRTLYYGCYSQWASRIHDDILFHTVPYKRSADPNSLDPSEYNKLGTPASHGCIRLQCVATKWINDNCPSGTRVIMYNSSNPGPLGKPKLEKIKSWHTWDPTDPTMKYKCKQRGCKHKEV